MAILLLELGMKTLFLILFIGFLSGCGSLLCTQGDTNQGLMFDFDPVLKTVDIGAYPTFHKNASFVKKLIVDWDGFLLVSSQKTVHCDNREEMKKNTSLACEGHKLVENYTIRRYTDSRGYEEWPYMPKSEWQGITSLNHSFSKAPAYHYKNCRTALFGGLFMLLEIINRV